MNEVHKTIETQVSAAGQQVPLSVAMETSLIKIQRVQEDEQGKINTV